VRRLLIMHCSCVVKQVIYMSNEFTAVSVSKPDLLGRLQRCAFLILLYSDIPVQSIFLCSYQL